MVALVVVVAAMAAPASAQPRAAMLQTSHVGAGAENVGRAFDRLARSRLEALAPVPIDAGPPLPLEDLQLAVGCVGESVECLRAVAERVGAQMLIVPSVEVVDGAYVGSFLSFAGEDDVRRVTRRARSEAELLDTIDPLLRELFDLPEPEDSAEPAGSAGPAAGEEAAGEDADRESSFEIPTGPTILAAAGAALLIGAGVFGALARGEESDYLDTETDTREGVDAATAHLEVAERDATIANVLLGVGAAAVAGGLVWWLLGDDSPFAVTAAPGTVSVALRGEFGGGS